MGSQNKKTAWKVLNRTKVLKTPIFDIFLEHSICPRNGKGGNFYVFDIRNWVNIVAVTKEQKIVMIRQFRQGSKTYEYEIPGGLIDDTDSSPLEAGIRELREETGYAGTNGRIIGKVLPNPALQGNVCYTALVENAEKVSSTAMEDAEDIETFLVTIPELEKMIRKGEIMYGLVLNALSFFLNIETTGRTKR